MAGNESGSYSDHASGTGEVGKTTEAAGAGPQSEADLACWRIWWRSRFLASGLCIAIGPIATALTGAGIGAAAGGLIGGLTKAGVSENHAEYYAEGVRRGGVLVTVRTTDALAERAADILDIAGATDVDERAAEWRSGSEHGRLGNTPATLTKTGSSKVIAKWMLCRKNSSR